MSHESSSEQGQVASPRAVPSRVDAHHGTRNRKLDVPLISPLNAWLLGGILVGLMVVGSFYDLQISEALLNEGNPVAILGAAYGWYPVGIAVMAAGILLAQYRDREPRGIFALQTAAGSVMAGGAGLILVFIPLHYMDRVELSLVAVIVVAADLVIVSAIGWLLIVGTRDLSPERAVQAAIALVVVAVVEVVVVAVLKNAWERPRMRLLVEDPAIGFEPWWHIGLTGQEQLVGDIPSNDFKSFPSAHTSNAAMMIMLTVIPFLKEGWARWRPWLFWFGALWAGLVAFTRIIAGAHFLTDTVVGFTVTFVCILLAYKFVLTPSRSQATPAHAAIP